MNTDLGMTPEQYGFGAGILFVGFLAGQFPSILLQQRFGIAPFQRRDVQERFNLFSQAGNYRFEEQG